MITNNAWMILASGFTDSAVGVIFGVLLAMVLVLHLVLLKFFYPKIMPGVFGKIKREEARYWLFHVGLFVLSILLLNVLIAVFHFVTSGEL